MKKKIPLLFVSTAFLLCGVGAHLIASNDINEAKATIALDDTTDYADKNNYAYRTKTTDPERAYSQTDLDNVASPVYTDLQYSSSKSLKLKDKGQTKANNSIAVLNPFAPAADVIAGNVTFETVKTKRIELMFNYNGGELFDLYFSLLDLETNTTRMTNKISIAPGPAYLSSTNSTEWYHFSLDMSAFTLESGKTDSTKVGGLRIDTPVAVDRDLFIDQLRTVDSDTFDPEKATRKPFNDEISMYESDDKARAANCFSNNFTYTESTAESDTYGESTRSLRVTAAKNVDTYGNFFMDLWSDGIKLDKFGDEARLVGYIKGSLTNTAWLAHATRFVFTFSTSDHQKATGDAKATLYFESFVEADDGWYYFDWSLSALLASAVSNGYPLADTTVYGLRISHGDYQVATGDYYVFDALMVVGYKDAYDLVDDVTAVDTCNSDKTTTEGFIERYNALNGYDKNYFDTTEVGTYTLAYKLNYMAERYGASGLLSSHFGLAYQNDDIAIIVLIFAGLGALGFLTFCMAKRRKKENN